MRLRIAFVVVAVAGAACGSPAPPTAPASPSPVAPARPLVAPQVIDITWRNMTPTLAHDPPCCGDPYTVSCVARDLEDDPVAVTLTLRDFAGLCPTARCWTESRIFPAGQTAGGFGIRVDKVANVAVGGSILTCQAIDSHGFAATLTSCIPLPPSHDCP
jgi:hypothetical protein